MFISIILPVYNAEKFIERCIQSLLVQSLDDVEVIMIDDCSKDNGFQKAIDLINSNGMQAHFKLLRNTHNLNCAGSRNRGISEATGEYITFVDSDDYVDEHYLSELMSTIAEHNSDVIIYDYKEITRTEAILHEFQPLSTPEDVIVALLLNKMHNSLCNKVFRRSLMVDNGINMPCNLTHYDDKAICFKLIYNAKVISFIPKCLYFYDRRNEGSVTRGDQRKHVASAVDVVKIIDDFFVDKPKSVALEEAIEVNKMHILGFVLLYGTEAEIQKYSKYLGKFRIKSILLVGNVPMHYRLAVLFKQNHLSFVTTLIRHALSSYQNAVKKNRK